MYDLFGKGKVIEIYLILLNLILLIIIFFILVYNVNNEPLDLDPEIPLRIL